MSKKERESILMSLLPKLFCYLGIIIGCFSPILSYIYMYQSNKISTSINDAGKEVIKLMKCPKCGNDNQSYNQVREV